MQFLGLAELPVVKELAISAPHRELLDVHPACMRGRRDWPQASYSSIWSRPNL